MVWEGCVLISNAILSISFSLFTQVSALGHAGLRNQQTVTPQSGMGWKSAIEIYIDKSISQD